MAKNSKSEHIPEGWEFWVTGDLGHKEGFESSWKWARDLKLERERFRPDLMVRVNCVWVENLGVWWIIRRDEPRRR